MCFAMTVQWHHSPGRQVFFRCAGFLCDEMGLGKSLESIMLVLANRAPPEWGIR